jgi:hypothetical protein
VIIEYLDYFIEHTSAGPTKQWKILLCDGHVTHKHPEFVIKAFEHNIIIYAYPLYLTHVL